MVIIHIMCHSLFSLSQVGINVACLQITLGATSMFSCCELQQIMGPCDHIPVIPSQDHNGALDLV